jgi:L-ascorbate metabolism protein UlaG (beta-lactamase superfamily)
MSLTARVIGGPTVLLEADGIRILTDPTFSEPGPQQSGTAVLTKLTPPALTPEQIGPIDVVLLSHDQHADNLDDAGRLFLRSAGTVVTTTAASERVDANAKPLEAWHHVEIECASGRAITVAAVPASHGPEGTQESSGPVIGFVVWGEGFPRTYVSGDNASLRVVEDVAHHLGPIELAVLFAGAARTPRIDAYVSLTSDQAAEAAGILGASHVLVAHVEGWAHFTEGPDSVVEAFAVAGLSDGLLLPAPGERVII